MTQTGKVLKTWFLLAVCLIAMFGLAKEVEASGTETNQIGFYLSTKLPENQRDRGKTYYDLHMEPDVEQKISFSVGNTGKEPIVVGLQINNAYTNTAGEVGYQIPNIKDKSLAVSMEDITELSNTRLELKPDESKEVFVTITTPSEKFKGEIIGGIVATKELDEEAMEEAATIINEYSYIVGLVVSESEEAIDPEITFAGIKPDLVNYKTAAIHSIRNAAPLLMDEVSMKIDIYKQGSPEMLWSTQRENLKLAPNSLMDYTFYLGEEDIQAGTYESHITIGWQGNEWNFTDTFEIELSTATRLNSDAIRLDNENSELISKPVAVALVLALVLILLALIILVIRIFKKKDGIETQEEK